MIWSHDIAFNFILSSHQREFEVIFSCTNYSVFLFCIIQIISVDASILLTHSRTVHPSGMRNSPALVGPVGVRLPFLWSLSPAVHGCLGLGCRRDEMPLSAYVTIDWCVLGLACVLYILGFSAHFKMH